jgi:hypothetical protein
VDTGKGGAELLVPVLPTPGEHFYNSSAFSTSVVVQNQLLGLQGINLSAI